MYVIASFHQRRSVRRVFSAELEVSDSGLYTCTASSESGETSWSASLSVEESPGSRLHRAPDPAMFPAAPSVPTIVNVTKNAVTVTWNPPTPHLGASPIIGYTLEYYSSDLQTGWVVAAHRISTNTMIVSINIVLLSLPSLSVCEAGSKGGRGLNKSTGPRAHDLKAAYF